MPPRGQIQTFRVSMTEYYLHTTEPGPAKQIKPCKTGPSPPPQGFVRTLRPFPIQVSIPQSPPCRPVFCRRSCLTGPGEPTTTYPGQNKRGRRRRRGKKKGTQKEKIRRTKKEEGGKIRDEQIKKEGKGKEETRARRSDVPTKRLACVKLGSNQTTWASSSNCPQIFLFSFSFSFS